MSEQSDLIKNAKIELLNDLIDSGYFNAIEREYLKYRIERIKEGDE